MGEVKSKKENVKMKKFNLKNIKVIHQPKTLTQFKNDLVYYCFNYYSIRSKIETKLDKLRYAKHDLTKEEEKKYEALDEKIEELNHSLGFDIWSYILMTLDIPTKMSKNKKK
ncbi:MAG: hypothetical protein Q4F88_06030 [Eubacteriales bacterium]|nr:hypothetical protein [Eubacteriales bacterium]